MTELKPLEKTSANRKKAEAGRTGGGPAPPPLTEAEELALSQNKGRPVSEGISGGSSSSEPATSQDPGAFIRYSDGVLSIVDHHATAVNLLKLRKPI
ncbi:hypothetical protein DPEC_G00218960 [Dallia pectoralis]|uniref:Uncharacterized protein n=1 Tax=Dallia pectoralis TaxID=75939 RepID=A0ACC2G3B7_DALPE|nr:hypothetical protein DPEC_G00218960 [Dallia pectoralis]